MVYFVLNCTIVANHQKLRYKVYADFSERGLALKGSNNHK